MQRDTNSAAISLSNILGTGKLLLVLVSNLPGNVAEPSWQVLWHIYVQLCVLFVGHVSSVLRCSGELLDTIHLLLPFVLKVLSRRSKCLKEAQTVYPPCNTWRVATMLLKGRDRVILSIAQFRSVPFPTQEVTIMFHVLLDADADPRITIRPNSARSTPAREVPRVSSGVLAPVPSSSSSWVAAETWAARRGWTIYGSSHAGSTCGSRYALS